MPLEGGKNQLGMTYLWSDVSQVASFAFSGRPMLTPFPLYTQTTRFQFSCHHLLGIKTTCISQIFILLQSLGVLCSEVSKDGQEMALWCNLETP